MIEATLKLLDTWYNEPSAGSERPKLLSKMAVLELCGWLEGEFDRLVLAAAGTRLNDTVWVTDNVVKRTSGFAYSEHWRPMLAAVVGEIYVRRVEARLEAASPGDLDRLRAALGALWKIRCSFAHADLAANVASQQSFDAPSWSINQHRVLKKLLTRYEQEMLAALATI